MGEGGGGEARERVARETKVKKGEEERVKSGGGREGRGG